MSEGEDRYALPASVAHVVIDEEKGTADCGICKTGVTCPPVFGCIPRSNMLASFVVQHSVHDKAGYAAGLTTAGNATKAARAALSETP